MSDTHGFHKSLTVPDGDILVHCGDAEADKWRNRKGTNGVSTNGVTANFSFFCQRGFLGTAFNLLLSSQKC